jgi:hypothetical protein
MKNEQRLDYVIRFYEILDQLERKVGGKRTLANCDGKMKWPERGVYFFFEEGEMRTTSGSGMRVVRIGTHALKTGSKTTLWKRLSQHQGVMTSGAGNHRGSVFRHHVGTALINRDNWHADTAQTWRRGSSASREVRTAEKPLERAVSLHIRAMPFLWLEINDEPGPMSHRGLIERNCIALLSNFNAMNQSIDPPSKNWLGSWAASVHIQQSGLWNVNHVAESCTPDFIELLNVYVTR